MDINTILVIGFVSLFSYLVYKSLRSQQSSFIPQRTGLLVAQDTGKTKHNQSKTGDASLAIERVRRKAIQASGRSDKTKLKETKTQLGSATGALETYMISSICPCPVPSCRPYDAIFDGGDQSAEYCEYVGDGYLDAGNDSTEACGGSGCKPHDAILDGGDQTADYCEYSGSGYLDAGDNSTKACGV